ncbi:hypothetical protein [Leeuwenhoekiella sp. MAR_2009_132]|nr:hypothetical protein [Leeuwenhoekiella sp. MAR_2009_132]
MTQDWFSVRYYQDIDSSKKSLNPQGPKNHLILKILINRRSD